MSIDTFLLSSNTTDLNYPEVRPTLDLNFARVKALDPRITFTRASGGSYVGADGLIKLAGVNEARFDHDPVTGESLGFLVEEARTNLISNSYSYHALYLTQFETNIGIAPDGTNTASKATPNNGTVGGTTIVHQNTGITLNGKYTYSAFVKPLVSSWQFGLYDNLNAQSSTITVTLDANGNASATGQDTNTTTQIYPNGWVRIIFTYIASLTSTNYLQLYSFGYGTGDGNLKAHLVWGVQYEQGAFPTSYIPTEGSSRTRASDFASITGKNFSDFYRQDEGTFIGEWFTNGSVNTDPFLLEASDSGRNVILYISRGSGIGRVGQSGATVGGDFDFQNLGALANNQKAKLGLAYKKNDAAGIMNGGTVSTDNQTGTITPDRLGIGNLGNVSSNYQPNGCIKRITYYPKRLPNAQLITLTR